MTGVTNLSNQQQSLRIILGEQTEMANLQQQLSSGKKTIDLSELTAVESRRLLDLRFEATQRASYTQTINIITPRLKAQDTALISMNGMINGALTAIGGASSYEVAGSENIAAQITGYLQQIEGYLNQQIDGRYLYAGQRYSTVPVTDLKNMLTTDNPPSDPYPFTATASPNLASYDTQKIAGTPTNAAAFAKSSAIVDTDVTIDYGVTSNDPTFQKLILGLRWAYAATQDSANYNTYKARAQELLSSAQSSMYTLQATNAVNTKQIAEIKDNHAAYMAIAQNGQDDIQKADTNAVAARISMLETQIQASYTVTAKIANLSLANYL